MVRHARLKAFDERLDLTRTVAPMGVGSVFGAVAGGLLVGLVPAAASVLLLGFVLSSRRYACSGDEGTTTLREAIRDAEDLCEKLCALAQRLLTEASIT